MFWAAAVAEVSGQLGKSLLKFCSGEVGPEGILPDTQLLDPLLKEASTAPLAQPPDKGMDGEAGVGRPSLPVPTLSPHPIHPVLGPQHAHLLQIDSSISTLQGPRGCPRLPLWCTAGKGPVGLNPALGSDSRLPLWLTPSLCSCWDLGDISILTQ